MSSASHTNSSMTIGVIISDQQRIWIASSLLAGVSEQDIISSMAKENVPASLAREEIAAARKNPYFQAAQGAAAQIAKQESILGILRSLRELDPAGMVIERRHNVSRKEFLEKYYSKNRPVILCGLMDGWRATTRWTPEYLKSTCGEEIVEISSGRNDNPLFEIEANKHLRKLRFAEYVDMVTSGKETNDFYITARNGFFERPGTQALLDDIDVFSEYLDPSCKPSSHFWYGPKGTVTPFHHDSLNILLAQLQGRKRIQMIPMNELLYMYNKGGVYTSIDAEAPNHERFPKYKKAQRQQVDLMPGEVLFIPVGWWHHVRALDTSISISFTRFVFPNQYKWAHPKMDGMHNNYDRYAPAKPEAQPDSFTQSAQASVVQDAPQQFPQEANENTKIEKKSDYSARPNNMSDDWVDWTRLNIERGCNTQGIYDILRQNEFDVEDIRIAMGRHFPFGESKTEEPQREKSVAPAQEHIAYKHRLSLDWQRWTKDNLALKANPEVMLETLLKQNFSLPAIKEAMGSHFPEGSKQLNAFPSDHPIWRELVNKKVDHAALARIPEARILTLPGAEKLPTDKAQVILLPNFLHVDECDRIIDLMGNNLRPSTITVYKEGFRTSMTCDLCKLNDPFVKMINEKIARAIGIRVPYSEGIQAQKYSVGQEFKAHTDYFKPGTREYEAHARERGNRTWTFMIYLNDTPKGGGTQFGKLSKTFYPKKGTAVIWNSLNADGTPNHNTLHWGMPVEEGEKYIITKWFRENGSGPMFFD